MVVRRDSLRAQRDFYSPMTGNTGTEIRYADAPTKTKSTYGSKVKDRLSQIGQNTRRSAPIIKAIKTAMKKTDDPFTQIAEQKSYAPQEENDIGAQIQGLAGQAADAVSQAQDAIGEGVTQARQEFEGYKKSQSKKQSERRAERAAERAADLAAAKKARQNIRTDFQNRVKGVSDEVSGVRQQVKTYESNRERQRRLTQARLKGIEKDVGGVRSEVKAYESNRERQRRLTQARLKGIESKQDATAKETKDYRTRREQMTAQRQESVDRRFGTTETGLSNLGRDYKAQEQAAIDNMAKFRAGLTADVDKKISEVRKMYGQGGLPLGSTTQRQGGTVKDGEKITKPKTVTIGGQTVAAKQSVASLPSNYKATEAKAFAQAKAFQEAKKIAQRNPNVSVGVDSKGKPTATANQKTRSEAGAKTAQANKARVQNNARARAQAAAVKRKLSGKSIGQTKAANRASMKQAAAARHASFKKAKAAGTHARTASAQRARNKAAAKARAKAAAKARNKKKSAKRGGASRRRGRRRGRRCDIFLKFDISLLTNNNLRHDELAEVAYFVRALRELD